MGDGAFADVWEDKGLKALLLIEEGLLAERAPLHLEPLTGEQFERVGLGGTLCLPLNARIRPHLHQPATFQATVAGHFKGDLGVGPKGEELFATLKVVLEAPASRA